jgi:hypothetical protein
MCNSKGTREMKELDEIKVLLRAAIEAEIAEAKAKHRALGLDASDIRAFSTMHSAQRVRTR